ISKKQGPVKDAKNKIDELFPTTDPKNKTKRQEWWNEHKEAIWEGMLCALSYDTNEKTFKKEIHTNLIDAKNNNTYANVKFSGGNNSPTLEHFAQRPQFLRWMIEWSEHFCKEQKKMYTQLVEGCNGYECNGENNKNNKKEKCRKACDEYKKLIQKWKPEWEKQSGKYDKLYQKALNTTNDSTEEEKPVVEYLSQLRTNSGNSDANTYNSAGKYVNQKGYVSDCDTQNKFETSDSNDKNYALREKPYDYEEACNCSNDKLTPKPPEQQNDVCTIVQDVLSKHKIGQDGIYSCNKKEKYPDWDCTKIKVNNNPTGICIPPRRQKFCTRYITLQNNLKVKEDIKKNFITCAAIETYFA
ncbi:hypothetical protein PFTANZ_06340, partial [Plasmodium falciparum Tanzania (2000708)]